VRKAIQSLGVVPRLFPELVNGEKRSTIRWREGPIEPGYMLYVCDGAPEKTALVWVTKVTTMRLRDAAGYLGREKEWPDVVMLHGMREHYSAITLDDAVEIVEHLTPAETRLRDDCLTVQGAAKERS
jgi:hypothetical protein